MRIRKCGFVITAVSSLFLATKLFAGTKVEQYLFPYANDSQPNLITIYKDPQIDSLANSLGYEGKIEDFYEIGKELKARLGSFKEGVKTYYIKNAEKIGVDIDIMDFIEGRAKKSVCIEWAAYMANLAVQKGYKAEIYVAMLVDKKNIPKEEAHAFVRIIGENEELILGINGYRAKSLEEFVYNIKALEEESGLKTGLDEKIFILKLPRAEDFDGEEKSVWMENADGGKIDGMRMLDAIKWFEDKVRKVMDRDPYKSIVEEGAAITDFGTSIRYKLRIEGF